MNKSRDREFLRLALERDYLTPGQVGKYKQQLKKSGALPLGELLQRQGVLSPQQVSELEGELQDEYHTMTLAETDKTPIQPAESPTETLENQFQEVVPTATNFGRYKILKEVAEGGMGKIFLALDTKLDRKVALKTILAGDRASREMIQRFQVEARSAGKLRHPNIIGIFDIGRDHGQYFFVMDYIEGIPMDQFLQTPLPLARRLAMVEEISRAVHYAHEKGIIHRDLKPSNVIVDREGRCHVMDFGLAKEIEGGEKITHTGAVMGTPAYMAPEQARGDTDQIDHQSDVYALGCILFEALVGRPPFQADNPMALLFKAASEDAPRLRDLDPTIDPKLERIVSQALAKNKNQRYHSALALASDIERFRSGQLPIAAGQSSVITHIQHLVQNPRHKKYAMPVGIVTLMLFTFLLGRYFSSTPTPPASTKKTSDEGWKKVDPQREKQPAPDEKIRQLLGSLPQNNEKREIPSKAKKKDNSTSRETLYSIQLKNTKRYVKAHRKTTSTSTVKKEADSRPHPTGSLANQVPDQPDLRRYARAARRLGLLSDSPLYLSYWSDGVADGWSHSAYGKAMKLRRRPKAFLRAARHLTEFLNRHQGSPPAEYAHYWRGQMYLFTGHFDRAIEDFTKVIEIVAQNPNRKEIETFFGRGRAYLLRDKPGDLKRAQEDLEEVVKRTYAGGGNIYIPMSLKLFWLAMVYYQQKNYNAASETFAKAEKQTYVERGNRKNTDKTGRLKHRHQCLIIAEGARRTNKLHHAKEWLKCYLTVEEEPYFKGNIRRFLAGKVDQTPKRENNDVPDIQ